MNILNKASACCHSTTHLKDTRVEEESGLISHLGRVMMLCVQSGQEWMYFERKLKETPDRWCRVHMGFPKHHAVFS